MIERAAPYCDVFAIGCSNHLGSWNWPSPEEERRVRGIDWRGFLFKAAKLLAHLNKTSYFKHDLLRAAGVSPDWAIYRTLDAAIAAAKGAPDAAPSV
jgi:hypothetical protein